MAPDDKSRPGEKAASAEERNSPSISPESVAAMLRRLLARIDFAEPMRRRAVQEAITNALAETWIWRSRQFEWARPRPGDFTGHATADELAAADERCAGVALACRNHAAALEAGWLE